MAERKLRLVIMQNETMHLRFGGDNDIDLETLTTSLDKTLITLSALSENVLNENEQCRFVVKNIQRGSFDIVIQEVLEVGVALLPQTYSVLQSFKTVLEVRKLLKGTKPEKVVTSGNNTTVYNKEGGTITVNNVVYKAFINDPRIERSCADVVKAVNDDLTRSNLIYDFPDTGEKVQIDRSEFKELERTSNVEEFDNIRKEELIEATVRVTKPDLENKTKWGVVHVGRLINADIKDEDFLGKVHSNEVTFGNGFWMKVKMKISYYSDENGIAANEPKYRYEIVKVLQWGSEKIVQEQLFDDNY